MGLGDFFGFIGKIGDRLVMSKKEALRREERILMEKMNEITSRNTVLATDADNYTKLSDRLSEIQKRISEIN